MSNHLWRRGSMILVAFACMLGIGAKADAAYVLTGPGDSTVVLKNDLSDLQAAALPDLSDSGISLVMDQNGRTVGNDGQDSSEKEIEIALSGGQNVTVYHAGASVTAVAQEETVSSLLDRLHVDVSPLDMVGVDISPAGISLNVASEVTVYERQEVQDTAGTIRQANADMEAGTEKTVREGTDGVHEEVYEVVYSAAGAEISRQLVETTESTAVDAIVEYGTKEPTLSKANATTVSAGDRLQSVSKNADGSGLLEFQSGAKVAFSSVRSMKATAYTKGHGGVGSITATGTTVKKGTVAVDPSVVPLGTRMYIVTADGSITYGMAVACDTGIRGNKLDLYYDTYNQCIQFGVRSCTVYILE